VLGASAPSETFSAKLLDASLAVSPLLTEILLSGASFGLTAPAPTAGGGLFITPSGSSATVMEAAGVCMGVMRGEARDMGVPTPVNGDIAPDGGMGIEGPSGDAGMSGEGKSAMWMRLAELL
jgi:hypothetical protein